MKKTILIFSVFSVFLPGLSHAVDTKTVELAGAQVLNEQASDIVMMDLAGHTFMIKDLKGQAVILHFWASWCSPCREELPALEKIHQEFKDGGLTVLAVSIEDSADLAKMTGLAASLGATFPVYATRRDADAGRYWSLGVPVTYFIDKNGGIIGRFIGEGKWSEEGVKRLVRKMAAE
ncbi:MAG: TlpA family protein disulfide reductase [Deltaproteobacteria bacterium]|nr:TlpA family protein disulfide reductase [Deltaproteobacteria bacterium]